MQVQARVLVAPNDPDRLVTKFPNHVSQVPILFLLQLHTYLRKMIVSPFTPYEFLSPFEQVVSEMEERFYSTFPEAVGAIVEDRGFWWCPTPFAIPSFEIEAPAMGLDQYQSAGTTGMTGESTKIPSPRKQCSPTSIIVDQQQY